MGLLLACLFGSCLKSLDYQLTDNPLDINYQGDFVDIIDQTSMDTVKNASVGCQPHLAYRLNPLTFERLKRIDMSNYEIRLNVKIERTTSTSSFVQKEIGASHLLRYYDLDTVFHATYFDWTHRGFDDIICAEFYLSYKRLPAAPTNPFIEQTPSQFLECYRCGG